MKPTEQKRKDPLELCETDAYPFLSCPEIEEGLKTTLSGLNARDWAHFGAFFRVRNVASFADYAVLDAALPNFASSRFYRQTLLLED